MPIKELRDLLLGIAVPSILSSFRSKSDLCSTRRLIPNQAMSDSQKPLLANLLPICSKGMKCFYFRLSYNVPFQVTGIATYSLRFLVLFLFFPDTNATCISHSIATLLVRLCYNYLSREQALSKKEHFWEPNTWDKSVCLPLWSGGLWVTKTSRNVYWFEGLSFSLTSLTCLSGVKFSGEPPVWRLWDLRCLHVSTFFQDCKHVPWQHSCPNFWQRQLKALSRTSNRHEHNGFIAWMRRSEKVPKDTSPIFNRSDT